MRSLESLKKQIALEKQNLRQKYNVDKIGVFGSYVSKEQRNDSDLDILVYFNKPIGWEFIDLKNYLESKLDVKIDLVTERALKPQLKESILKNVEFA